jgi:hypothetical protein
MNPDLRGVPDLALNLVFAKPIVDARVKKNAAAMGVDRPAMIIRPGVTVDKLRAYTGHGENRIRFVYN